MPQRLNPDGQKVNVTFNVERSPWKLLLPIQAATAPTNDACFRLHVCDALHGLVWTGQLQMGERDSTVWTNPVTLSLTLSWANVFAALA